MNKVVEETVKNMMQPGERTREDKLKEVVGVTSRCIPFNQEHLADTCVCCGKPATKMVYWGKAY